MNEFGQHFLGRSGTIQTWVHRRHRKAWQGFHPRFVMLVMLEVAEVELVMLELIVVDDILETNAKDDIKAAAIPHRTSKDT